MLFNCDNNPKASYTIEINKHKAGGFSLFAKNSYCNSKNERYFYEEHNRIIRSDNTMSGILWKLINMEHKLMIPFTIEKS